MREVGTGEYFDEDGNVVRPFEYKAITTMTTDELAIHRGVEIDQDDIIRREVIMQLICHFKLIFADIAHQYLF